MASLEGVLAGIPGYGGYLAQRQMNEQAGMQDLQQFGAVQGVLANLAAQQQKQQLNQALQQSGGDLNKAMEAAIRGGNLEGAAKLGQLIEAQQKRNQPQAIGAGGLRMPDGTIIAPVARPTPERPTAIGAGGLRMPDGTIISPVARQEPKTNDIRNYEQAKQDGFKGTFLEYQTQIANARRPSISQTVTTGGDKKYLETRGTDLAKSMGDLEKAAGSAYNTIQAMDRFIEASKQGPQGSVQPVITGVQNFLSSFGYESKDLTDVRKMEQAIGDVLQNKMSELGARGLTDRDMDVLRQALPRVATDAASRQLVADIVKRGSKSTIDEYIARRDEEMRTFPDFATRVPTPPWLRQYRPQQPTPGIPSMDAIDAEIRRRRGAR